MAMSATSDVGVAAHVVMDPSCMFLMEDNVGWAHSEVCSGKDASVRGGFVWDRALLSQSSSRGLTVAAPVGVGP